MEFTDSFLQELVRNLKEAQEGLLFVGEELPGLAFLEKESELTWNYTFRSYYLQF